MNNKLLIRANRMLDDLFSYQGIDTKTLRYKKTYGLAVIILSLYLALMFFPVFYYHVSGLLLYGILLLSWYIPFLVLFILLPYPLKWLVHISQHIVLFFTYFIIIKLGGIAQSGGIIFTALSAVMFSLLFYSILWSMWYFILFVICTGVASIIQFRYQITPEMSPEVNHIFFLINMLIISGIILVMALVYLNQHARDEKEKADRLKELDKVKTRLYTNITHEFRTPLTVILGVADQIEMNHGKGLKEFLSKIRRNSRSLLHLVNQMLNLSKLEAGVLTVHMIQDDIIKFIRYRSESFSFLAQKKKINFQINSSVSSFFMDYDPDKLSQILSNLLSNAIKYTKENGAIWVVIELDEKNKFLTIRVEDTGIGISTDKLTSIFDRFYRADHEDENFSGSSGLGLAITKELVKLLQGKVEVESQPRVGSQFSVILPVSQKAPIIDKINNKYRNEYLVDSHRSPELVLEPVERQKDDVSIILIVEDNSDVIDYLATLLTNQYRVAIAHNGKEGLEKARNIIPDIIVSDVMMPVMNGIFMLRELRSDMRTSHIPIVMLTAKADMESKLEGLLKGADAYIVKPFRRDELFVRLATLIEQRKKLQERYVSLGFDIPALRNSTHPEDAFINRLHETFIENLRDENFGILDICKVMHMSRTQLYRKFKALTNRPVIDYLHSFRLHKAKQLLQDSNLNVTQVAFEVGFKNLSHFSKSFSDEFGQSPREFKQ